ncbi:hypothetical protein ACWIGW_12795 [Nocardia brasiliensis]
MLYSTSIALHELSGEASELDVVSGIPKLILLPIDLGDSILSSVVEASRLAVGVQHSLVPAVAGRLAEMADLMNAVSVQFQKAEDESVGVLAAIYTKSSGDWGLPK